MIFILKLILQLEPIKCESLLRIEDIEEIMLEFHW